MDHKKIIAGLFLALIVITNTISYAEEAPKTSTALTTVHSDISPEKLNLMVRHMTADELFIHTDG